MKYSVHSPETNCVSRGIMAPISILGVILAILGATAAFADDPPKPLLTSGPDLDCEEIAIESLRLSGRKNQIELDSIGAAKGKADAATMAQLIFVPALFLRQPQAGLDEHAWLAHEISHLEHQASERKCAGGDRDASRINPTALSTNASPTPNDGDYERALTELENGRPVKALWAKSLAESNGNDGAAKSIYIRLRVEQFARERDTQR